MLRPRTPSVPQEVKAAEELEATLLAEIEADEEERLKSFDEVSSPGVAEEARKLSEFRLLEYGTCSVGRGGVCRYEISQGELFAV